LDLHTSCCLVLLDLHTSCCLVLLDLHTSCCVSCCWIYILHVVSCAVGFTYFMLCLVLLDLHTSCCVLCCWIYMFSPVFLSWLNRKCKQPLVDWTPLRPCDAFVKLHSRNAAAETIFCLSVTLAVAE
jgi:hypothetical protein